MKITIELVNKSKTHFDKFLINFKNIFGYQYLTPNFHDLEHLPDIALSHGPLYEFSGANFEHLNGQFVKMCSGNKRLDKQIIQKFESYVFCQDYCSVLFESSLSWKKKLLFKKEIFLNGRDQEVNQNVLEKLPVSIKNFFKSYKLYNRATIHNKKISTQSYVKKKAKNGSNFISKNHDLGFELKYIVYSKNENFDCVTLVGNALRIEEIDLKVFGIRGVWREMTMPIEDLFRDYQCAGKYKDVLFLNPNFEFY